jgi:hypothetical protein
MAAGVEAIRWDLDGWRSGVARQGGGDGSGRDGWARLGFGSWRLLAPLCIIVHVRARMEGRLVDASRW